MPEPAPGPDGEKLLNSAIIEQDYANLPGLCGIERDDESDDPAQPPPETPPETKVPAESDTSEAVPAPKSPVPPAADVTPCNQMQHDSENRDDVASAALPRDDARSRHDLRKYLEVMDSIKSFEQTLFPKIENEDSPTDAEVNEEEILV